MPSGKLYPATPSHADIAEREAFGMSAGKGAAVAGCEAGTRGAGRAFPVEARLRIAMHQPKPIVAGSARADCFSIQLWAPPPRSVNSTRPILHPVQVSLKPLVRRGGERGRNGVADIAVCFVVAVNTGIGLLPRLDRAPAPISPKHTG